MRCRIVAVALWTGACGSVAKDEPVDSGVADQAGDPARIYHAHVDEVPAVPFGGLPYCNYTITLQQLDIDLEIHASGLVSRGAVQNLNLETALPPCPNGTIPPAIAKYTLASAQPSPTGTQVIFTGDAANAPVTTLGGTVTRTGGAYRVTLGFQRTDSVELLNWSVIASAALAPN